MIIMAVMNAVDLHRVDLNLLVVFQVLHQERHVTRAAKKLNLSQSAVSAALSRLRVLLDDVLFVRTRDGMTPTSKSLAIAAQIAPALTTIFDSIFEDVTFDPHGSRRTFHVAMSDDIEIALGPWLIEQKREHGWSVQFAIAQTNSALSRTALDDQRVDAVLSLPRQSDAAGLHSEPLFSGGFLCLHDPRQTGWAGEITTADYLDAQHIRVSYDMQRGWVDEHLAALGRARSTLLTTSHFAVLPRLLQSAPAVATIPAHAATALAASSGLRTSRVPIEAPRFSVSASWRTAVDGSPENHWLREQLKRFAATL